MAKISMKRLIKMKIQKARNKVMMEILKTVMKTTVQMETEVSERLVFKNNFNLIIHQQIKKSFKENLHLN
jgi:hypothetical protein